VVRFPDGRELGRSGAVKTEINPAGLPASNKDSFRHGKCSHLKLVMFTKSQLDVFTQTIDIGKLMKTSQHCWLRSPGWARSVSQGRTYAQVRGDGVNADKGDYRQNRWLYLAPESEIIGGILATVKQRLDALILAR